MAKNVRTTNNENPAETAERTLRQLQARAAQLAEMAKAEDVEMADLAFRAHTGDQRAAARAEALTDKAIRRQHEARSLEAAIVEATTRVQQARAAEAQAADRKAAEEAREIADKIDMLFASADKHFAMAFDALKAADGRIEELHRLGFAFPTAIQVRSNAMFALQTYFMALPKYWWNELSHSGVRFLAPHERRTFSQFWGRMVEPIARNVAARLDVTKTAKAVA